MKCNYETSEDDFKSLIEDKGFFVDKTLFIKDFLENGGSKVQLITRPRRFGKSLNMSMLNYFLNMKESSKDLFKNFKISSIKESISYMNKFSVVHITFKDIYSGSYEKMLNVIYLKIIEQYKYHQSSLIKLKDEDYISNCNKIISGEADESLLSFSLNYLTKYLYEVHGKRVIVLIDEYDKPFHESYGETYFNDIRKFFNTLLSSCLKGNQYIYKALITGIVAEESILSELNNIKVYSVIDKRYSQYFGFTEEEVANLINEEGLDLSEVKFWYNGYNFSGTTIYNPYSILSYPQNRRKGSYWLGTGLNQKKVLIDISNTFLDFTNKNLNTLLSNKPISYSINKGISLEKIYSDEKSFWELLLHSGYLTVQGDFDDESLDLIIPNYEVKKLFKEITAWFIKKIGKDNLISLLFDRKEEMFKEKLENILIKNVSYYDTSSEAFFHPLIFGSAISLDADDPNYRSKSNIEAGLGRADIVIENVKRSRGMIIEIKKAKDNLKEKVKEGMNQIKNKQYHKVFDQKIKDIRLVSLAFEGKKVALKIDEITLT